MHGAKTKTAPTIHQMEMVIATVYMIQSTHNISLFPRINMLLAIYYYRRRVCVCEQFGM